MNKAENTNGVTTMQKSHEGEVIHLFKVMKMHNVLCSFEIQTESNLDPLYGRSYLEVNNIEYFERPGGPDALVVELGESEFGFDVGNHEYFKDISDCQILICVAANEHYSIWFNSSVISPEGIEEARNYVEVEDGPYPDMMLVSSREEQLINYLRTLKFDDLLDASTGLEHAEEDARNKAARLKNPSFTERADILEKLSDLLCWANDDYRDMIDPDRDLEDEKEDKPQ